MYTQIQFRSILQQHLSWELRASPFTIDPHPLPLQTHAEFTFTNFTLSISCFLSSCVSNRHCLYRCAQSIEFNLNEPFLCAISPQKYSFAVLLLLYFRLDWWWRWWCCCCCYWWWCHPCPHCSMPINSVYVCSSFHHSFGTLIFVVFTFQFCLIVVSVCKTVVGEVNVISTHTHTWRLATFLKCVSLSLPLSRLFFSVLFAYGESAVVNITATNVWRSHYTSVCLFVSRSLSPSLYMSVCRTCSSKKCACVYTCVCVFAYDGCFFSSPDWGFQYTSFWIDSQYQSRVVRLLVVVSNICIHQNRFCVVVISYCDCCCR